MKRLWHIDLIENDLLPKSQLIALWRELNSIFTKQDDHILINFVYECDSEDLYCYALRVICSMKRQNIRVMTYDKMANYFNMDNNYLEKLTKESTYMKIEFDVEYDEKRFCNIFKNKMNSRYLSQCFCNLQEKYDCGQKDFSKELYDRLENYCNKVLINNRLEAIEKTLGI